MPYHNQRFEQSSCLELNHFFDAYLNQDYELSGEAVEEIVECYKQGTPAEAHRRMVSEIERFISEHPDLDEALSDAYGNDFSPELWGYTTASFLEELKRLLSE
ncbi:hypothetical protein GXB81_12785 [Paraburkholderia sp. Ac-20336]|nr:hypothetical protein [Paraburkholderia sp. Ac-20336]MBN3846387.1 hypothetical protein [Paraburkholderia sp. Ac-20342]